METKGMADHSSRERITVLEHALLATERAYRDQKLRADYWEEAATKRSEGK